MHASPDGTLKDLRKRKEYLDLLREADSEDGRVVASFGLDETKSFCIAGRVAGIFISGEKRHVVEAINVTTIGE